MARAKQAALPTEKSYKNTPNIVSGGWNVIPQMRCPTARSLWLFIRRKKESANASRQRIKPVSRFACGPLPIMWIYSTTRRRTVLSKKYTKRIGNVTKIPFAVFLRTNRSTENVLARGPAVLPNDFLKSTDTTSLTDFFVCFMIWR